MFDLTTVVQDLAASEAMFDDIRPGCEKRIVWAGPTASRTKTCLLYIHGFSATGRELDPLPEMLATTLGANVFYTRLAGHGRTGPAMAEAQFSDWRADTAEAFAVAGTLGETVIAMGCSTGCTLITDALARGQSAQAVIYVSPNFGVRDRMTQILLDLPGARHWGPYVTKSHRTFEARNALHASYWTLRYPMRAVFPVADAVRAVRRQDLSQINVPAYFAFNPTDTVVSTDAIRKVIARWGGAVYEDVLTQTPDDDEGGHVMAGDALSPGQTAPLAARISAWLEKH